MTASRLNNHLARAATIGLLALASPAAAPSLQAAGNPPATVTAALETALTGAWELVGQPGHITERPLKGGRIKIYAGNHWCMIQADPKTGVIIFHHGGIFTLDGSAYHETVQFAGATTMDSIGRTNGHFKVTFDGKQFTAIGVDNDWKEVWQRMEPADSGIASPLGQKLTGAWVMSGAQGTESQNPLRTSPLKLCANGHWCDVEADAKTGIITVQHGGTYTLDGNKYSETVDFADPGTMNLIGHTFTFAIKIEGDKLALNGIKNPWNEVWTRAE